MAEIIHQPVMPEEVIKYLHPQEGEAILDGTIGLAGHARIIAEHLSTTGTLLGIDQDKTALNLARKNLAFFQGRLILRHGNFRNLKKILEEESIPLVDGILLDIGVSSLQLDLDERGFSYHKNAPLDMRMDSSQGLTAADIINNYSLEELTRIIREYGEERWAARIAEFIVEQRAKSRITTTEQLVAVIKAAIPASARRKGPHPARRTFQAIRIAVNEELEALIEGLESGLACLKPGGRIVVISFHSLEDRIVKRMFKAKAKSCRCPANIPICQCSGKKEIRILTSRPVVPSEKERAKNPRSRSAKLRAAYKLV